MSEVGVVVKYLPYRFWTPHMPCTARIRFAKLCVVVVRGNRHTVLVELISNVMWTYSRRSYIRKSSQGNPCTSRSAQTSFLPFLFLRQMLLSLSIVSFPPAIFSLYTQWLNVAGPLLMHGTFCCRIYF